MLLPNPVKALPGYAKIIEVNKGTSRTVQRNKMLIHPFWLLCWLGLNGFYAEADFVPLDDIPVRNYFPETWEWQTVKIPTSGEFKLGKMFANYILVNFN